MVEQAAALRQAAGQAFYNTSRFTLRDLRARASRQQLTADFEAYLDGFSPNVQDILDNFEFRNQIPRLSCADALGTLVEKLTITVDAELLPIAKRYARSRGVSLSSLIEQSLREVAGRYAPSFAARWRGKFRAAQRDDPRYEALAKKDLQ